MLGPSGVLTTNQDNLGQITGNVNFGWDGQDVTKYFPHGLTGTPPSPMDLLKGGVITPGDPFTNPPDKATVGVGGQGIDTSRQLAGQRSDLNELRYTIAMPQSANGHIDPGQTFSTLG